MDLEKDVIKQINSHLSYIVNKSLDRKYLGFFWLYFSRIIYYYKYKEVDDRTFNKFYYKVL